MKKLLLAVGLGTLVGCAGDTTGPTSFPLQVSYVSATPLTVRVGTYVTIPLVITNVSDDSVSGEIDCGGEIEVYRTDGTPVYKTAWVLRLGVGCPSKIGPHESKTIEAYWYGSVPNVPQAPPGQYLLYGVLDLVRDKYTASTSIPVTVLAQ